MRREFYEIYKDLYDLYRRARIDPFVPFELMDSSRFRYFDFRSVRLVTEAIEHSVSELRLTDRIRPDARHFLLINFHQMVVLPLVHPEAEDVGPSPPELQQILRDDSAKILSEAIAGTDEGGEVTASDVLRAISTLWDRLAVSQFRVWG